MSNPITLELTNEFLALQRGRCITCRKKFSHCGGTVDLHIPCQCCFAEQEGLECVECAKRKREARS